MKIFCYNYRRMNQFLRKDLKSLLDKGLSMETDDELYQYQSNLEKDIGTKFTGKKAVVVTSGFRERNIGKVMGGYYAIGTSSGTAGLQFSLIALGIGKGDEVITAANTYVGVMLGISNTGARPKLVDVNDKMLIDTEKIEENITSRTKAIVPVHLYGQMAAMDKIRKIAKRNNLLVIEDAAHSPLARYDGKLPGEYGDSSFYSFYPNKILGAATNGGLVITKNKKMFEKIRILRDPSSNNPLVLKSHRTPAYLDWIQMVFINSKLKYLPMWTKRRKEVAKMYFEGLKGIPIVLPKVDKKAYHVYCNFVIMTKKRKQIMKYLKNKGIQTAIHYEKPLHLLKTYKYLGYKKGDFPVTERLCNEVVSLPMNPFITNEEVEYVIRNIKEFFKL